MAENDKDNTRVVNTHFQKSFNNNQPTDFSVPQIIKQQKSMCHIDDPITWDKLN